MHVTVLLWLVESVCIVNRAYLPVIVSDDNTAGFGYSCLDVWWDVFGLRRSSLPILFQRRCWRPALSYYPYRLRAFLCSIRWTFGWDCLEAWGSIVATVSPGTRETACCNMNILNSALSLDNLNGENFNSSSGFVTRIFIGQLHDSQSR